MDVLNIKKWLQVDYSSGDGSGYGYGSSLGSGTGTGHGYGSGSSPGYGDSFGFGSGDGTGSGDGYGSGFGSSPGSGSGTGHGYGSGAGTIYGDGLGRGILCKGVSYFCKMPIFNIDGIPTIIKSKLGNIAKGFILQVDFTLKPCYIAKNKKFFAHGETIESAVKALRDKIFKNLDTEETIERFISEFNNVERIKGTVLFEWHHYLTGSCLMGRNDFVKRKGLNLEDEFTVEEFIKLCENDFGSDVIKQLKERWDEEKNTRFIKY
jgi:hypothetical protein